MKSNFEIELLPEVIDFLENLEEKPREKIYYNIKKAQFVNDNELFKKLNDVIWEFRTLYNGKAYRLFSFWDKLDGQETLCCGNTWNFKENAEDAIKRNKKGRRN